MVMIVKLKNHPEPVKCFKKDGDYYVITDIVSKSCNCTVDYRVVKIEHSEIERVVEKNYLSSHLFQDIIDEV